MHNSDSPLVEHGKRVALRAEAELLRLWEGLLERGEVSQEEYERAVMVICDDAVTVREAQRILGGGICEALPAK